MSNALYWQVSGQGHDLVLVHGWGMNGAVWQQIVDVLDVDFRVHVVDLPGYGHSAHCNAQNLEEIAEQLMVDAPKNAIWVGWSLGGLVATHMAIYHTDYVNKLVTVASSPKFSADKEPNMWRGIQPDVLTVFTEQLMENFQTTIERFMALQSMGSPSARKDVKQLKQAVLSRPLPDFDSLLAGLKMLSEIDLRPQLTQIPVPMLRLYGRLDALVPVDVAEVIGKVLPNTEQYIFNQSSHAPFMTEANMFCEQLLRFANK
ncbi:pimeloyl-ACP methyl ester esterase BioH [Psychromonas antarctica]|uniref:pimeloyl-ACP methyl ester esterase BioH n=1 Tax=Psychromonas antarctica TaxID=67573 RepID=UPI001EE80C74|nr:pimeloyl-ACP methyl ester esterase BioH [Psychromonas antarctica]MCG6202730.1 pimeloyl-ACP methyl ester esterase BioH [Psychromonas antarctica]